MKVKLTSTIILDDNEWGFTDLMDGRPISPETINEIKELIMEDSSELNNPDNWKLEIVTSRQERLGYLNQNKDE